MRRGWIAVVLLVLAAPCARAQDVCAEDVVRLCPQIEPGSGRIATCLRAQEAKLSPACRGKLDADAAEARKLVEAFGRACGNDVKEFCGGVEPGGGRVLTCLARRQLELSPTCQAELGRYSEARETVAAFRTACTPDVARFCSGVPQQAGPLLACLRANEASLSPGCGAADLRRAAGAASVVDAIEEMSRQDRLRETLEILQGTDAVAFSRSQILLQYDSYEKVGGVADATRLLFNPQLVFGKRGEYAFQVKVPVVTLHVPGATQHGIADVTVAFAWGFQGNRRVRQYLSAGLQCDTSSLPSFGSGWVAAPAYALSLAVLPGLSITTQAAWFRTIGEPGKRPKTDLLVLEPIVVANLPGRTFLALDTKLGWNFIDGSFLPLLKGMGGLFTDREKTLSISAWYQLALADAAREQFFDYEVGLSLAHYFNW